MKRIVIAMDSFKGTLTAVEACERVRDAIASVAPDAELIVKPMADGGEGTADALLAARGGTWVPERVMGPLEGMQVDAGYGWIEEDRTAVVEMATASGLVLLTEQQLNPLATTTYGTGQLIHAAVRREPAELLLAVGGSATVDGGVGAAQALGWRFLDEDGEDVPFGGGSLERIARIERPQGPALPPIKVLCDVDNPLCGPEGAAAVYGPQKGATPEMVDRLDAGLSHLAECVRAALDLDIGNVPGAGAAGGLAAGAMAFMGASFVPGIETVIQASGLASLRQDVDWVLTGEGRFDSQSLRGKVVSGVVGWARQAGARVAVLAGCVEVGQEACRRFGVETARATKPGGMSQEQALHEAGALLWKAARAWASETVEAT